MNKISILDSNVIKPVEDIPKESLRNYHKYYKIVEELNRRERKYNSYKYPPRF